MRQSPFVSTTMPSAPSCCREASVATPASPPLWPTHGGPPPM
ncbi:MAG: hypothetical protein ACK559_23985 [bacterium]